MSQDGPATWPGQLADWQPIGHQAEHPAVHLQPVKTQLPELPRIIPAVKHLVVTREFPSAIPGRGSGNQRMAIPAAGHTLA